MSSATPKSPTDAITPAGFFVCRARESSAPRAHFSPRLAAAIDDEYASAPFIDQLGEVLENHDCANRDLRRVDIASHFGRHF